MSANSDSPVDYLPPGISIFGGLPTKGADLAPSIVFIVAYVSLIPLALWRSVSPKSRTWILLRPDVFIGVRIATFIIRTLQATGTYTVGLFIGELILEISGFNIICEPLVRVLEQNLHSSAYNSGVQENLLIQKVLRLMRLGLLVSLVLGIYTGTQYSDTLTQSKINSIDTYRLATSGLNLSIVGLTIVLSVLLHRYYQCQVRATGFVLCAGFLLIVPSAYRLAAVVNTQPLLDTSTKIYFYVFGALFEFLGCLCFIAPNLHSIFDLEYKFESSGGPIGALVNAVRGPTQHVNHPPNNVHRDAEIAEPYSAKANATDENLDGKAF